MKTEGLSAKEATEIIQRGGVVKGCTMAIYTAKNADGIEDYAPYRVVTPPPDAEPTNSITWKMAYRAVRSRLNGILQNAEAGVLRVPDVNALRGLRAQMDQQIDMDTPDAEPVVTAEELIRALEGLLCNGCFAEVQDQLDNLKAARAPKPEPQPIRTLAEALACRKLRLEWPGHAEPLVIGRIDGELWPFDEAEIIDKALDGYDKGRRVYDASEEEQAK